MTLLRDWLDETSTSVADVAARLSVAPSTVYRWRDGIKVPRPKQTEALAAATGGRVTANDHQAAYAARQRSLMGKGARNHAAVRRAVALPQTGEGTA